MKAMNLLCVVLFVGLLSCEKHEGNSSTPESAIEIAGDWEIVSISGGITGRAIVSSYFKYLSIKLNGEFCFSNDTAILAIGTIKTEIDSRNDIWYYFNVDSTKYLPIVPLPTNFPKTVLQIDSEKLVLADPCCDLYSYIFVKKECLDVNK
ncbi:MAG: hypothetical protein J6T12_02680 [Salinivirgaceae bacterium]|nr:hypothetical protein [Salinivirgaceae bacterium]